MRSVHYVCPICAASMVESEDAVIKICIAENEAMRALLDRVWVYMVAGHVGEGQKLLDDLREWRLRNEP